MGDELNSLTRRVEHLERSCRYWRGAASLAVAALGLMLFIGATPGTRVFDVLETKLLRIVDDAGHERAVLSDGRLSMSNEHGSCTLSVRGGPRLALTSATTFIEAAVTGLPRILAKPWNRIVLSVPSSFSDPIAWHDGPSMFIENDKGIQTFVGTRESEGVPVTAFSIFDSGNPVVALGLTGEGVKVLYVYGDGKASAQLSSTSDGAQTLLFLDRYGKFRVGMGITAEGEPFSEVN